MEGSIESNKILHLTSRIGKVKQSDIFMFLVGIYFFMYTFTHGTNVYQMTGLSSLICPAWKLMWLCIRVLILLKVIKQYKKGDEKIIALLIFSYILGFKADGAWFSDTIWLVCSLRYVNYKALLKRVFIALFMSFVCVVGLCYIGKITDDLFFRSGEIIRHSYGYMHPNTFAIRVFELCALYSCIKNERLRYYHSLIFLVIMVYVKKVTDSTTAVISLRILALTIIFVTYANNHKNRKNSLFRRFIRFCIDKLKYVIFVMPMLAIFVVIFSSTFQKVVKGTLLSRVIQARYYFYTYGINLFGNKLKINGPSESWSAVYGLYTLDNGYMYLLLGYGIIAFIIFIYYQVKMFRLFAKEKNYITLAVMAIYAVYGFMEVVFIRVDMNFTLLFMGMILWNVKKKKADAS